MKCDEGVVIHKDVINNLYNGNACMALLNSYLNLCFAKLLRFQIVTPRYNRLFGILVRLLKSLFLVTMLSGTVLANIICIGKNIFVHHI